MLIPLIFISTQTDDKPAVNYAGNWIELHAIKYIFLFFFLLVTNMLEEKVIFEDFKSKFQLSEKNLDVIEKCKLISEYFVFSDFLIQKTRK